MAPDAGSASLDTIAIQVVAARGIVWREVAAIGCLVARIIGARNAVGANDGHSGSAPIDRVRHRIALLDAVAIQVVRARVVVRHVRACVCLQVAEVGRAAESIVAIERRAILAIHHRIADLDAVAGDAIVTESVVRRVCADALSIAGIHGALDAVVAILRRVHARARHRITRIVGARIAVVAILYRVHASTRHRITRIGGAGIAVVAALLRIRAGARGRVACVDRASDAVIAGLLRIRASIRCFVTAIVGAAHAVIARLRRICAAGHVIAAIVGAEEPVVAIRYRRLEATRYHLAHCRIARLDTVARLIVVACCIVRRMRTRVIRLVATICRARCLVVARRWRSRYATRIGRAHGWIAALHAIAE